MEVIVVERELDLSILITTGFGINVKYVAADDGLVAPSNVMLKGNSPV